MKLSTQVIQTIEMSPDEYDHLWAHWYEEGFDRMVCGMKGKHWITEDGHDDMLLEGETSFRKVIIK